MKIAKTVLISGHFNVLHPGHIRLFKLAKHLGNRLIVAVESNEISGSAAYVSEKNRLEGVKFCSLVDEVIFINDSLEKTLKELKPDIVLKGKEFEQLYNVEKDIIESFGGKLLFSSGEEFFATREIVELEKFNNDKLKLQNPNLFVGRHNIEENKIKKIIDDFSSLKVLVVGDTIVDEYISCNVVGLSQEDMAIVHSPDEVKKFVGGASIVASHASSLGAETHFFSVTGVDDARIFISEKLKDYNVAECILNDLTRPTTVKQRYKVAANTAFRLSILRQEPISIDLQNKIVECLSTQIEDADLLVISDFNYGLLTQGLINKIELLSNKYGVPVVVDSQSSSQIGDITRYRSLLLTTPTEREARLGLKNNEDGLVVLTDKLLKETKSANVFMKMGENGVLIHTYENGNAVTDQIPALNKNPIDISGAGDSMLIVSAMALVSGANIWEAGFLGSIAAGIQISRTGNIPLSSRELIEGVPR